MSRPRRILSIARDQGSIQAIAPVLGALAERIDLEVTPLAFGSSDQIYCECGIMASSIDYLEFLSGRGSFAQRMVEKYRPELVLLGSSAPLYTPPETPEQFFLAPCKSAGIPTVSVLDAWGYYVDRFGIRDGVKPDDWLLPDKICVLDRVCRDELVQLGIPAERLEITHNPWLDRLRVDCASRDYSPQEGELRVLFVSQPLLENQCTRKWPYTQHDLFSILVDALRKIGRTRSVKLLIWVHPSEDPSRWEERMAEVAGLRAEISAIRGWEIFSTADVLVTSHSTAVYEALHYDLPCIILRPRNPELAEHLSDKLGLTLRAYDAEGLISHFCKLDWQLRFAMRERRIGLLAQRIFFSDGGATDRVVAVVGSLLK